MRQRFVTSHPFVAMKSWPTNSSQLYRDGKRVLECLQRALRVADSCMETAASIELFVEILDRYVYYFDQQNESVSSSPSPPLSVYKATPTDSNLTNSGDHEISQRSH
jgi:hypothetical protein